MQGHRKELNNISQTRQGYNSQLFLHFLQDHRISNPNDNSGSLAGGENAVALKMQQINREIEDLQRQKKEVQANIAGGASNNAALLQRFRYTLHEISGS